MWNPESTTRLDSLTWGEREQQQQQKAFIAILSFKEERLAGIIRISITINELNQ